jgi:hypothetical protein
VDARCSAIAGEFPKQYDAGMGYADEREPIDWKAVAMMSAIGGGIVLVMSLIGAVIYGVIYYEHLPSPAQKAAQEAAVRFEFLEDQHASDNDLCAAAGAAKAAYENVQDATNYREWASRERTVCMSAELERRLAEPTR